jgi:cytochrome c-type biogenesis protein CcmH
LHRRDIKWTQAVSIVLLLLALGLPLAAIGAARPSVDAVAEGLTCQCGCGLTVANCNHPQCEFSVPMRTQIEGMIARGLSRSTILATFRAKYGEKILSAPTTEGFNLMAWLTPFGVLLAGGALIVGAFGRWRSRAPETPPSTPARDDTTFDSELRKRLESAIREDL